MEKALVDRKFILKKFPGKGGWTYAEVPEIAQDKSKPFGWVPVKGSIDDYNFKQFKLMPMGEGKLFFSVNAKVRKKIKKEAGDTVYIILYPDHSNTEIPSEFQEVLDHETASTKQFFLKLNEGEKKAMIDWIYSAKTEETIVNRMVEIMEKLRKKEGFYK